MSDYFRGRLLQLEFDRPAAVRVQGLAIGINVSDEDYADAIHDKCRRNGLLVSTEGSTVLLLQLTSDRRERAGHSGALDMMRRDGVAANPRVQPESPPAFTGTCRRTSKVRESRSDVVDSPKSTTGAFVN